MYKEIEEHCNKLINQFDEISEERKLILQKIAAHIQTKLDKNEAVQLVYVCTHNSRRSHFGQVWAAVAADFYGIKNVYTFSGGTEATAFNPNAINALVRTKFIVSKTTESNNPIYKVQFGEDNFVTCFSKTYNDKENPANNFVAVMTCSDADENCPFITGCDLRIGTTYEDPKKFDGTPLQDEKYLERSNQIAVESLYIFSLIK
ncbi:hypothetical protein ACQ33O_12820 [Ferruginibacter sp. SUN002]|uniref:hypothetical protein n=1 Tax=Ferruginibacter sp. SUN002 TaxID=2937789 RepID=UPI003D360571